jgi:hypothetical protein
VKESAPNATFAKQTPRWAAWDRSWLSRVRERWLNAQNFARSPSLPFLSLDHVWQNLIYYLIIPFPAKGIKGCSELTNKNILHAVTKGMICFVHHTYRKYWRMPNIYCFFSNILAMLILPGNVYNSQQTIWTNIPDWENRISFSSDELLKHTTFATYYGVVLAFTEEIYYTEQTVHSV